MTNGPDNANTAEEFRPVSNGDKHMPRVIILMGVSGTGKSTLGKALAETLRVPFIDGDDLHPAVNVAKMARGEPLDDADRMPWLEAVRNTADERARRADPPGVVLIACSALKRTYRAALRGTAGGPGGSTRPTCFVYLEGRDRTVLQARMSGREGHFMKAGMLASQLDALESPAGEPGVVSVSVELSTAAQVRAVVGAMRAWDAGAEA